MILVINAGSSSLKIELFDHTLTSHLTGSVSGIGNTGTLKLNDTKTDISCATHADALNALLTKVNAAGHPLTTLTAAAHRVVHGGANLTAPARVTPDIITQISACIPLAPLHNPHNLAGINAVAARLPDLPQYVSFDTAFHATNSPIATTYAIPQQARDLGLRRYGFHGLSYASMVAHFGENLPPRLLALHLGNGASLCAIKNGKSEATSMGYSPLSGLTMGTRAGNIDGMAVLRMASEFGIDEAGNMLNRASGLHALGGTNNMKILLETDSDDARFAVAHFCHWAAREAASAITAMGGVDAVAFTGGIGENAAPIRDKIMAHLAWIGPLPTHIIAADEERQIARDALQVMEG